ncbi:CBS domain-containing protein [Gandjariella thermophila]|nr:CBS domain-containing protein [Gandjariella thermophila]
MRNRTVADVMHPEVLTVTPTTTFKDIVDLAVDAGVSAVPVVDKHGGLLGVVSEADLLHKMEHLDETKARPRLFALPRTRRHWRKTSGAPRRS